jgi:hypothetical protein
MKGVPGPRRGYYGAMEVPRSTHFQRKRLDMRTYEGGSR